MKIAIIGTKGIPPAYGGFETFAWKLSIYLYNAGHSVTVVNEKDHVYVDPQLKINVLYSDYYKSKNPLQFYRQSLQMVKEDHDIILVCGVGGAVFFTKGKSLIVNNVDGLEHLRRKFTFLQRKFVSLLQLLAARKADYLIADSDAVKKYWVNNFPRAQNKISSIAYGAEIPEEYDTKILGKFGLVADQYFLVVARLVPENNIEMIIEGYKLYGGTKKLVIVGNVDDSAYSKQLAEFVSADIIFTNGIYHKPSLDALRKFAFAYLHGHSVGGTNPSLLEAMACECACICHDNEFNREVTDNDQLYFNSAKQLADELTSLGDHQSMLEFKLKACERIKKNYTWEIIGSQYEKLFLKLINERSNGR